MSRPDNPVTVPLAGYTPQHFLLGVSDGVATVTLNRPERKNAMNQKMKEELRECWQRVKVDPDVWLAPDDAHMSDPRLAFAVAEARAGLAEGGIPIGAALLAADGTVLGRGHNRRVQDDDPSMHAETSAFRDAGRQRDYRDTTMVTTLSPCWYCSGLVRQFNIGAVIIGEAQTFTGGHDWLRATEYSHIAGLQQTRPRVHQ